MSLGSDGSYVFSYQAKSGGGTRVMSKGIPTILNDWLYEKDADGDCVRHFRNLDISLGPRNESFWATDGDSAKWSNLPEPLLKALSANLKDGEWIDKPRIVTLGVGGDYVMMTTNNAAAWRLSNYKEFDAVFDVMKENGNISMCHVRAKRKFHDLLRQSNSRRL
jgi:hypothetical protein